MASPSNQDSARTDYEKFMTQTINLSISTLRTMRASFQRPLSRQAVSKIVANWNPTLWEMPVVCRVDDGSLVLVEGQHRIEAAAQVLGDSYDVECRLASGINPAELFIAINESKRRIQPIEKFTALVEAKDSDAVSILNIAQFHGFDVRKSNTAWSINAADVMFRAYRGDYRALTLALEAIAGVIKKRNDDRGWSRGNVILAVWYFIRVAAGASIPNFIESVSRVPAIIAVPYHTNEFRRNVDELISLYNKNRHQKNRVEADWTLIKDK